ncbi:MAG: Do family serine endopeptidase [Bacteroidales bacterium]|nr:Do family serine endopeptidase [Bacteroidales bacterium]
MRKSILISMISLMMVSPVFSYAQAGSVDFVDAAEKSVHAVVHVKTEFARKNNLYDFYFDLSDLFKYFGQGGANQAPVVATGSGVIISSDGYIVTNNHVVQDAIKVEVTLNDKRTYTATVVGTDSSTDLAVIKIEEKNLPYMSYGDSDKTRIGEWVLAIGNPLNLTSTVTAGIISAKARNINLLPNSEYGSAIESFIQTDAAVNPGNSGGALVNTNGDLIGINTAIASGTGYYAGYSFAIPVNLVKKVAKDIIDYGKVQRAILGVSISNITDDFAKKEGLKVLDGAYVSGVSESGNAAKAGIKEGDIIVGMDGKDITSTSELLESIGQRRPNETVAVTVNRDGKIINYNVLLAGQTTTKTLAATGGTKNDVLGAEIKNATNSDLAKYNSQNGVIITKIYGDPLKSAGVKEGFLITKIDNSSIRSVEQLTELLSSKNGGVLMEGKYGNGSKAYYGFGI